MSAIDALVDAFSDPSATNGSLCALLNEWSGFLPSQRFRLSDIVSALRRADVPTDVKASNRLRALLEGMLGRNLLVNADSHALSCIALHAVIAGFDVCVIDALVDSDAVAVALLPDGFDRPLFLSALTGGVFARLFDRHPSSLRAWALTNDERLALVSRACDAWSPSHFRRLWDCLSTSGNSLSLLRGCFAHVDPLCTGRFALSTSHFFNNVAAGVRNVSTVCADRRAVWSTLLDAAPNLLRFKGAALADVVASVATVDLLDWAICAEHDDFLRRLVALPDAWSIDDLTHAATLAALRDAESAVLAVHATKRLPDETFRLLQSQVKPRSQMRRLLSQLARGSSHSLHGMRLRGFR